MKLDNIIDSIVTRIRKIEPPPLPDVIDAIISVENQREGIFSDPCNCPIALTLKDLGYRDIRVGGGDLSISSNGIRIARYTFDECISVRLAQQISWGYSRLPIEGPIPIRLTKIAPYNGV